MSEVYSDVKTIIQELYDEFLKEEKNINEIFNSNSVRIDELDQKIHSLRKSEDVDFKVFSPRNSSNINSEKIIDLEKAKEKLLLENRNYSKQIKYYSDKVNRLKDALTLLGEINIDAPLHISAFSDIPNEVVEEKPVDPFDELFPSRNKIDNDNSILKEVDGNNESENNIFEEKSNSLGSILDNSVSVKANNQFAFESEINTIIHKVEFTEKIVTNDSIRAKLELKEIVRLLRDLFKK